MKAIQYFFFFAALLNLICTGCETNELQTPKARFMSAYKDLIDDENSFRDPTNAPYGDDFSPSNHRADAYCFKFLDRVTSIISKYYDTKEERLKLIFDAFRKYGVADGIIFICRNGKEYFFDSIQLKRWVMQNKFKTTTYYRWRNFGPRDETSKALPLVR
jgi:hypothetical protein